MSHSIQTHWSNKRNHTETSHASQSIKHNVTWRHIRPCAQLTLEPLDPGTRAIGCMNQDASYSHRHTVIDNAGQHPLLQRRLVVYSEVSSRGKVAVTLKEGEHWICFLELQLQLTSFLGRRALSPGISYGRRKGSAGPCHALDPTGKGRLTVFPWVRYFRSVANLSEPKPDTLLGPIDSWDSFSARSGARGFWSLAR